MGAPKATLLEDIRKRLRAAADPIKAPQMQAYMKSTMPYHGVPSPLLKTICKEAFLELEFKNDKHWQQLILELWEGANFREERYAALRLAAERRSREFHTPKAMPLFEQLIVQSAWWDFVDEIAGNRLGAVLEAYPEKLKPMMREWSVSPNLWKRRTSILCQLTFKSETDLVLLYDCIEPSMDSKEFFLRKAIGWALRQYARVDGKEVVRYVKRNEVRLSGLSKREALKHVK